MKSHKEHEFLTKLSKDYFVVLIDGECVMCDSISIFILNHSKRDSLRIGLLQDYPLTHEMETMYKNPKTVIVIDQESYYFKSAAFFKVISTFPFYWKALYLFKPFPRVILDYIYDVIARNRYKFFGKKDACTYPLRAHQSQIIRPMQ